MANETQSPRSKPRPEKSAPPSQPGTQLEPLPQKHPRNGPHPHSEGTSKGRSLQNTDAGTLKAVGGTRSHENIPKHTHTHTYTLIYTHTQGRPLVGAHQLQSSALCSVHPVKHSLRPDGDRGLGMHTDHSPRKTEQ